MPPPYGGGIFVCLPVYGSVFPWSGKTEVFKFYGVRKISLERLLQFNEQAAPEEGE